MTILSKIGTFEIYNGGNGFFLQDTCRFNNWGHIADKNGIGFPTLDAAEDYAVRCHSFKTGRRMSV